MRRKIREIGPLFILPTVGLLVGSLLLLILVPLYIEWNWPNPHGTATTALISPDQLRVSPPAWSPVNDSIIIRLDDKMYSVQADGSGFREIEQHQREVPFEMAMSSQGRLAYHAQRDDGWFKKLMSIFHDFSWQRSRMHLVDVSAEETHRVASVKGTFRLAPPAWSPNGQFLAYATKTGVDIRDDSGREISEIPFSTREQGLLFEDMIGNMAPGEVAMSDDGHLAVIATDGWWSPDRTTGRFALLAFRAGDAAPQILLTAEGGAALFSPVWSRDGERVLYLHAEGDDLSLRAIRLADGVEETISTLRGASEHPEHFRPEYAMSLAPNGRTALLVDRQINSTALHTVDLESGDHQKVLGLAFPIFVSWSPDGTRIAVMSPREQPWLLYTISPSGGPNRWSLLQIGKEGQIELGQNWP